MNDAVNKPLMCLLTATTLLVVLNNRGPGRMLLDNPVSLARKAREAILAVRIEEALSKERILELYLNEIYLGLQSYGVAAAVFSRIRRMKTLRTS